MSLIAVNKPKGLTPLQAIDLVRQQHPQYAHSTIGYAGRLDPLAQGVLLLAVDHSTHNIEQYWTHDKTYRVQILFGIETDTFDPMGIVQHTVTNVALTSESVHNTLLQFTGTIEQVLPAFSAAKSRGKRLYHLARTNTARDEDKIVKTRTIDSLKLLSLNVDRLENVMAPVLQVISTVKGKFRQTEILDVWQSVLQQFGKENFYIATVQVQCSAGTYMRSLAHDLGAKLNTGAIALEIVRTHVGDFSLDHCLEITTSSE